MLVLFKIDYKRLHRNSGKKGHYNQTQIGLSNAKIKFVAHQTIQHGIR